MSKAEIWEKVDPILREIGYEIFDIDLPKGKRGALAFSISKIDGGSIGHEDCSRVSKAILLYDEKESIFPDEWMLEVSSPGINRKLTRPEHFRGAIGERIKINTKGAVKTDSQKELLGVRRGILLDWNQEGLVLDDEEAKERILVPYQILGDVRVDFNFDNN